MESWGGSRSLQPATKEAQQGGGEPGMLVNTGKLVTESRKDRPEPLVCLLGCANDTRGIVEGLEVMALVDIRSQIFALTEGFCTEMRLRILPLRNLMRMYCISRGWGHFYTVQRICRG